MTNVATTQHADPQQHRIAIAVRPRPHHLQSIAGSFSLGPQRLPGAAVERDVARPLRSFERLAVHKAQHQQLSRNRILNHRGREALHFVEINLHCNLPMVAIPDGTNARHKQRARCAFCVSGLGFLLVLTTVIRHAPPTRSSHGDGADGDAAKSLLRHDMTVSLSSSIAIRAQIGESAFSSLHLSLDSNQQPESSFDSISAQSVKFDDELRR